MTIDCKIESANCGRTQASTIMRAPTWKTIPLSPSLFDVQGSSRCWRCAAALSSSHSYIIMIHNYYAAKKFEGIHAARNAGARKKFFRSIKFDSGWDNCFWCESAYVKEMLFHHAIYVIKECAYALISTETKNKPNEIWDFNFKRWTKSCMPWR
jgi:hypothetical protein